jgi:hypothetical protein
MNLTEFELLSGKENDHSDLFFIKKNVKKRQFNYLLLIKYWNLREKRFSKGSICLSERMNLRENWGLSYKIIIYQSSFF